MAERPEDLNLPNAVIARIIKEAVPEGVNLSKDARVAISKAASVFVLYATSCSNTLAMKAKRKTINAQDVINAMDDMEFEKFMDPLKECLQAYRNEQKNKRVTSEKKKKETPANAATDTDGQKSDNLDDLTVISDDENGDVNETGDGDEIMDDDDVN